MCTAVSFTSKDHYFGRNLDLSYSYQESVTITPRNYPFHFRRKSSMNHHFAMIGMSYVYDNYPLYYEATNEKGLSMAGLRFAKNAVYHKEDWSHDNIAPYELIPWILGQCVTVAQAKDLLEVMNILAEPFHPQLPLAPLHWMISDRDNTIVVESVRNGLKVYDNPTDVLTNNPPFPEQMLGINNHFNSDRELPGGWSSSSRFIRAAYIKKLSVCEETEQSSVSQFFHILDSVAFPRGCVASDMNRTTPQSAPLAENETNSANTLPLETLPFTKKKDYDITRYSSCCNSSKGIYYYKTYEDSTLHRISMNQEDLDGDRLISYPFHIKN